MSSGELIAVVGLLCLLPLWAAGSIILFALGAVRCGRSMDPYYEGGGDGGKREHCPVHPQGPRDDGGRAAPKEGGAKQAEAEWWAQFERDLGRYVEDHESCPSGHGAKSHEQSWGAHTRA